MIKVKRVYDQREKEDGFRILVDRLWPRGLSKGKAGIDLWLREIAPGNQLCKWFSHDPQKWPEFQSRYTQELSSKMDLLKKIREIELEKGTVTLLYSTKEERYNNAVALSNALNQQEKSTRLGT